MKDKKLEYVFCVLFGGYSRCSLADLVFKNWDINKEGSYYHSILMWKYQKVIGTFYLKILGT